MNRRMMKRRQILQRTGAIGLSSLLGAEVFAAVFLEIDQAQRLLLPEAEQFLPWETVLDAGKLEAISSQSETRVPKNYSPRVWQAIAVGKVVGWIVADRVIGKYDWIDYAVGFSTDGVVSGIEVMAYRESHGAEIRQPAWRKQFNGRKGSQNMSFPDDIRNISGATLSCQHVTEGVRRLSVLVSLLKNGR